jgi:aminopeptidase N
MPEQPARVSTLKTINPAPQQINRSDYTVPPFIVDKVDLTFNLEEDITRVKSHLILHTNPEAMDTPADLTLYGDALELESVSLNGKPLQKKQFKASSSALTIFDVPTDFELEITTLIKPQLNTALSGLYKSSGNFCTQCEAEGFRRITYFLDRPDVMARYTTTIVADQKLYPVLLSNGNPVDSGTQPGGKHWVKWEDPFKKPSYLFALVAGDLEFIEDFFTTQSGRRIILRIFVEKGNKDKCDHAMQAVKKAMRWDEIHFGREYDLDIYMIVAVSDFNMGAMENKGLNIFNTKYILAKPDTASDDDFIHVESVIAHEYFHNWTGNRITCRDWFQLSLKEGLTIFRDQSFTADTTSRTVARITDVNQLRTQQFPEDNGPLAHPVRPESYIEINNFYTSTIYNKGAEVIRMLKTILGDKLFRKGMDLYFVRHDGYAVTIEDFVKAMEDAAHLDLTQFRLWYSQAGTPTVVVTDYYDAAKKTYSLTFKQSCQPTPGQPEKMAFYIPVKIGLLDKNGAEIPLENSLVYLKDSEDTVQFDNIPSQPIPSLLRDFSAPVKIHYDYSDAALEVLFRHDSDGFNRWEAGQKYAINSLMRLIADYQNDKNLSPPEDYLTAFTHVLRTRQDDKLFLAEMLTLPSEKYVSQQMEQIDIDAVHEAREFLLLEIATRNKELLLQTYNANDDSDKPYEFTMEAVGRRRLKNLCLFYLMLLPDAKLHKELGLQQFHASLTTNMTDTIATLRCLVNIEGPVREQALQEFYDAWKHDSLVLDKWFSLQAMSKLPGTLDNVKKLIQHEAFDLKNPNKVYALVGAFGGQNLFHFHAADGSGYVFLAEFVQKLDAINPQGAARLVQPLAGWKRFDKLRQKLMCAQLKAILENKKLSNDVYELVSKSLAK